MLFLPEFLSNQLEILTQHSQSSQEGCYNFSKTSIVFFRINQGFSGSLYSRMAKSSFCLLVKLTDTVVIRYNTIGEVHKYESCYKPIVLYEMARFYLVLLGQ